MEFDHFDLSVKDLSTQNVITMCNSSRPLYNIRLPSCSIPSSSAAPPFQLLSDELRQQQVQGGQDRREATLRKTDRETRVGSRLFLFIEKT
jgi:hypothetical protein